MTIAVVAVALMSLVASLPAAAAVNPRIEYDTQVSVNVVLPVDPGRYKVRLKVKWEKTGRTTTFSFRTTKDFIRQCPNSTCVPNVWAFDYLNWDDPKPEPEFSFMAGDVTARITVWRGGGPRVFDRAYASYWVKSPNTQIIRQGTDAFVNYCIDGNHEIRSSSGRLYCVKVGLGRFKVRPVG